MLLAAYEAAASDPDIQLSIMDRESQRERTATWIVDGVVERARLRPGLDRAGAIDTVWMLMDPAIFKPAHPPSGLEPGPLHILVRR